MSRSLSPLEAKLILHLEWEKQSVVTIQQVMEILGCSYDQARQLLHRLSQRRWLAPIQPGKYELIPAERGVHAFPDTNPLFIGSVLVSPYYFSYATAAFFHGLSTQASATVYIATTERKAQRLLTVRGKSYRLVAQPTRKFFGAIEVDAYGTSVMMADPVKTVVDALDRPAYVGGIPEVAAMLWRGKEQLDWNKLVDYALRIETQSLVQRLGYLVDLLKIPMNTPSRDRLLAAIGKSTIYLGRLSHWDTGGEYDSTWRVVNNLVTPKNLILAQSRSGQVGDSSHG